MLGGRVNAGNRVVNPARADSVVERPNSSRFPLWPAMVGSNSPPEVTVVVIGSLVLLLLTDTMAAFWLVDGTDVSVDETVTLASSNATLGDPSTAADDSLAPADMVDRSVVIGLSSSGVVSTSSCSWPPSVASTVSFIVSLVTKVALANAVALLLFSLGNRLSSWLVDELTDSVELSLTVKVPFDDGCNNQNGSFVLFVNSGTGTITGSSAGPPRCWTVVVLVSIAVEESVVSGSSAESVVATTVSLSAEMGLSFSCAV